MECTDSVFFALSNLCLAVDMTWEDSKVGTILPMGNALLYLRRIYDMAQPEYKLTSEEYCMLQDIILNQGFVDKDSAASATAFIITNYEEIMKGYTKK